MWSCGIWNKKSNIETNLKKSFEKNQFFHLLFFKTIDFKERGSVFILEFPVTTIVFTLSKMESEEISPLLLSHTYTRGSGENLWNCPRNSPCRTRSFCMIWKVKAIRDASLLMFGKVYIRSQQTFHKMKTESIPSSPLPQLQEVAAYFNRFGLVRKKTNLFH